MVGQKGDVNLEVEYPIDKTKCCIIYAAQPMLRLIIYIYIYAYMYICIYVYIHVYINNS